MPSSREKRARSYCETSLARMSRTPETVSPSRSDSRRTWRTRSLPSALTWRCSFGMMYIWIG